MTYTHKHEDITVTAVEQPAGGFGVTISAGGRTLTYTFPRAYTDSTARDAAHWALTSAISALQSSSSRYDTLRAEWDVDAVYRAERSMTNTDTRHCWIDRWHRGEHVMQCDRCETIRPHQSERTLPQYGCKGSLYERFRRAQVISPSPSQVRH